MRQSILSLNIPLPLGATHGRLSVVYALVVGNLNLADFEPDAWVGGKLEPIVKSF